MNGVTVGLVSQDRFFREGLNALLTENGYRAIGSVSDHRELAATVSMQETPVLVMVDLAHELEAAASQLRYLRNHLPGVTLVAFGGERDIDWVDLCDDYNVGALLRRQVSFDSLLRCLELVMVGEKVLPAVARPKEEADCDCGHDHEHACSAHARPRSASNDPQRPTIPCMTCGQPFPTEDRRSNRICPNCKARMSRMGGVVEHTLHY